MQNYELRSSTEKNSGSIILGILGAFFGALIGAIPWAIAYSLGWFVGWLGFLIGICVSKGYDLLRGRSGWSKLITIVIAILFGVLVGQVLGDFIAVWGMIDSVNFEIKISRISRLYWSVFTEDAEFRLEFAKSVAFGLVFAGLGTWRIIKDTLYDARSRKTVVYRVPVSAEQQVDEEQTVTEQTDVVE
ncbi:MAG: hypothetical protein LBL82_04025 [Oscillospiraceae bacterium]|nr:hypothetical protein [Oscillospiraceae bacterium]